MKINKFLIVLLALALVFSLALVGCNSDDEPEEPNGTEEPGDETDEPGEVTEEPGEGTDEPGQATDEPAKPADPTKPVDPTKPADPVKPADPKPADPKPVGDPPLSINEDFVVNTVIPNLKAKVSGGNITQEFMDDIIGQITRGELTKPQLIAIMMKY